MKALVAQMTNPDWLRPCAVPPHWSPTPRHDPPRRHRRSRTGVPCIVGARTATKDLTDGMVVTVDGTHGRVLGQPGRTAVVGSRRVTAQTLLLAGLFQRSLK